MAAPDFIPDSEFTPDPAPQTGVPNTGAPQPAPVNAAPPQATDTAPDFIPDDQFVSDEDKYSTPTQMLKTAAEGLGKGIAGPVFTAAETGMFHNANEQMGRAAANPFTHTAAEVAGFVAPALASAGASAAARIGVGGAAEAASAISKAAEFSQAGILEKLGGTAAGALNLGGKEASLLSKIGAKTVSEAVQMAALQSGDEVSKMIQHDPNQTAETVIGDVGLATVLGGGVGAALGSVAPLWKATVGDKAAQLIEDFKGRMKFNGEVPDPTAAVKDELTAHYAGVKGAADEVYGPQGLKAKAIDAAMPEMHAGIQEQAKAVSDRLTSQIAKMKANPTSYPPRLVARLEGDLAAFNERAFTKVNRPQGLETVVPEVPKIAQEEVRYTPIRFDENPAKEAFPWLRSEDAPPILRRGDEQIIQHQMLNANPAKAVKMQPVSFEPKSPGEVFNATQDLKQNMQGFAKYAKRVEPFAEEYDFVKDAKQLALTLRESLEDSNVWGKAADIQKKINGAFTEYLPTLEDFEKRFTTVVAGERQIDPGKIQTYMNQLGKPNAEIKQQQLQNFLDASEKYKKIIGDAHASIGVDSPIQPSSLAVTRGTFDDLSPGARLADYFAKRGIYHLAGETLGTATGAAIGHVLGHGALGALVGEKALSPFFKSVLPALAAPFQKIGANSAAVKAAIDYGLSAAKADGALSKAARGIFRDATDNVIHLAPHEGDRTRLDKALKAAQNAPIGDLTKVAGNVGHFLPDHATAIGQTTGNAVQYLNSLRPDTTPASPLDKKMPPSPMKQAAYNRALDLANKPLLAVSSMAKGQLTPADVNTVKTLYPAWYAKVSQKLTNEMMDHVSKGRSVPYATRQQLSLFLGQPLDSTMTQAAILAAQPKPQQSQNQPSGGRSGKPPRKSSVEGIGKLATLAQTPGQTRAAARAQDRG